MKYIENTAEYEFVLNDAAFHDLMLGVITKKLQKGVKYKLKIINREYGPQHRTVRYKKHSEYFSFPTTVFGIYSLIDDTENSFHFYQFFLKDDGLRIILTESIYNGLVCLGLKTNNGFMNIGLPNLTMDEFVDEFWLTKFDRIYAVKRELGIYGRSQPATVYFPIQDFIPQDKRVTDEFIKI